MARFRDFVHRWALVPMIFCALHVASIPPTGTATLGEWLAGAGLIVFLRLALEPYMLETDQ